MLDFRIQFGIKKHWYCIVVSILSKNIVDVTLVFNFWQDIELMSRCWSKYWLKNIVLWLWYYSEPISPCYDKGMDLFISLQGKVTPRYIFRDIRMLLGSKCFWAEFFLCLCYICLYLSIYWINLYSPKVHFSEKRTSSLYDNLVSRRTRPFPPPKSVKTIVFIRTASTHFKSEILMLTISQTYWIFPVWALDLAGKDLSFNWQFVTD